MDNKPDKPWWQPAMVVFAEVTGWIAVPIIVALFVGKYLDDRYGTAPWWYLGLTGFAFIITSVGIASVGGKYIKQMEQEKNNESRSNSDNSTRRNSS